MPKEQELIKNLKIGVVKDLFKSELLTERQKEHAIELIKKEYKQMNGEDT